MNAQEAGALADRYQPDAAAAWPTVRRTIGDFFAQFLGQRRRGVAHQGECQLQRQHPGAEPDHAGAFHRCRANRAAAAACIRTVAQALGFIPLVKHSTTFAAGRQQQHTHTHTHRHSHAHSHTYTADKVSAAPSHSAREAFFILLHVRER